jgi:hypothetical protein
MAIDLDQWALMQQAGLVNPQAPRQTNAQYAQAQNQNCAQQVALQATTNNSIWAGRKFWDKVDLVFRAAISMENGHWVDEQGHNRDFHRADYYEPEPFPPPQSSAQPRLPKAGETWRYAGSEPFMVTKVHEDPLFGEVINGFEEGRLYWSNGMSWTFVSGPDDGRKNFPGGVKPLVPTQQELLERSANLRRATMAAKQLLVERGPSAVASAAAREPWRPSVDEWDLLPDAKEGWRR